MKDDRMFKLSLKNSSTQFDLWATRMKSHFQYVGLWNYVSEGVDPDPVPAARGQRELTLEMQKARAMRDIMDALEEDVLALTV